MSKLWYNPGEETVPRCRGAENSSTGKFRPSLSFVRLYLLRQTTAARWERDWVWRKSSVTEEHWRPWDSYYFCSHLNYFPFLASATLPWRSGEVIEKQLLHQESNFSPHFWHAPLGSRKQRPCLQILIGESALLQTLAIPYQWHSSLHLMFCRSCDQRNEFTICLENRLLHVWLLSKLSIQLS